MPRDEENLEKETTENQKNSRAGASQDGASALGASEKEKAEEAGWEIKRVRFLDPELQKLQDELFADEEEAPVSEGPKDEEGPLKEGHRGAGKKTSGSGKTGADPGSGKALPGASGEKKGRSRRKHGILDKLRIRSHDLLERITESGEGASSIDDGDVRSYLKLMWGNIAVRIAAAVFFIFIIAMVALAMHLHPGKNGETEAPATPATASAAERQLTEEELRELEIQNAIDNELMTYTDLGIVDVSGYINVRSQPDVLDMTNIIGQLTDRAVCSIVSQEGDWYLIESGGITGYASAQYIITGEEAMELARESFADRAIIETEVLNIRSAPTVDAENVIGKARMSERYEVLSVEDEWARIKADFSDSYEEAYIYIGDGNAVIRYCLNEARRLDLREMALTQYDQLVVAATDGYINIRETPETGSIDNVCGKFPENAGAELLETVTGEDGQTWYRIRSGDVTGYVSAQYCVTGNEARNIAVNAAQLTAYITTDALNVRSEPSLDAEAWTQVTRNQSYHVLDQLDGWVEIELDSTDDESESDRAFISTRDNNVEVTYGLPVAIEYYPAVEAANAEMAFRNQIVNYAVQFVGNPYVWGGTSLTNGCDCSGFTQSVLRHFGISIPRVSRDQARSGSRVTSDVMRPGDLVFYANSSGTINHVAMYIGNGQVVNAASRRSGITIYRWNYRTPVAIRDVIGDRTS